MMGQLSNFLQDTHKEKIEKEEKDKEEKEKKEQKEEEKEQRYREERNGAIQWMARQDDKNQTVPQSVITRGTSEVNISTITSTSNSNKQIVVSPRRTYIHTPRKHRDEETINIIEETITKKQKTKDDDRDQENSGRIEMKDITTTIGTES